MDTQIKIDRRTNKIQKNINFKRSISTFWRYLILIAMGIVLFYPFLWLIGASFKTNAEIFTSISIFPKKIDFSPYINGWRTNTEYTFATYFANTFKYVIPKVILTVISSVITAYGFSRFNFPGKKILFALLIATLLLPKTVLRVPSYLMFKQFHMLDTFFPLYIGNAFAIDAFFVFMLIQFFRSIPRELDEAAQIDGCNSFQTLIYVLTPVLKPAIITVALFQFMWTMNDFMGPLLYISSVEKYPIAIALKMSMDTTSGSFQWNQVIAMSIISLIPSIIVFLSAQKYFIEGIATTGLKD